MKIKIKSLGHGFSLVEIMIAMALGLFIIAGLATVYVSSKDTYALRDQISELDENARVAMKALRTQLENAGYNSTLNTQVSNYLLPSGFTPSAVTCPTGQANIIKTENIFSSADGPTVNNIGGDRVGISFLADDKVFKDCTDSSWKNRCTTDPTKALTDWDNETPQAQKARRVYSSFKIVKSTTRKNSINQGIPELICGGSLNTYTQPWAQGIENMQLRYGVDIAPNPIPVDQKKQWQVDQYWTATEVTNNNAWDKVALVQVALLVRTVDPVFKQNEAKTYQLFEQTIATNDRYKRAVYTTTIYLRNVAR